MSTLTYIAIGLATLGGLLMLLALGKLWRRRPFAAAGQGLIAALMLALGGLLGSVGLHLHTYQRLSHEQDVAALRFRQLGPQRFLVTLELPGSRAGRQYELLGDDWQLDARVLKWHSPVTLLGVDSHYRLERLSGRYRVAAEDRQRPRSVHPLAREAGLDLWTLAQDHGHLLPWMDAQYGSATYLPMADDAEYQVKLSQTGLLARPANEAARRATGSWR